MRVMKGMYLPSTDRKPCISNDTTEIILIIFSLTRGRVCEAMMYKAVYIFIFGTFTCFLKI